MGGALKWGHSRVGVVLESRSGAILAAQSLKWCHPRNSAILEARYWTAWSRHQALGTTLGMVASSQQCHLNSCTNVGAMPSRISWKLTLQNIVMLTGSCSLNDVQPRSYSLISTLYFCKHRLRKQLSKKECQIAEMRCLISSQGHTR